MYVSTVYYGSRKGGITLKFMSNYTRVKKGNVRNSELPEDYSNTCFYLHKIYSCHTQLNPKSV